MGVRAIDTEKCTGCGLCVLQCPMDVLRLDTFNFDKEEIAPCQEACPAGVNIRGYMYLFRQRRYEEAATLLKEALPIPAVTGRVCFHPCELECARKEVDEAVNINAVERYLGDYSLNQEANLIPKTYEEKVAVVGSGPAGLACAYELLNKGYSVTVFEAATQPGGMLRYGIPEYRLPKAVLDREIEHLQKLGVEIRTNETVTALQDLFKQGYHAVFLAIGTGASRRLRVPNEEATGVIYALDLLREVNSGNSISLGNRVGVIGGGNAAIDAARVARKLGAEDVRIIYRRSEDEMPAIRTEVREAKKEGVDIHTYEAPVKILIDGGQVTGIQCIRMQPGQIDASRRRASEPILGSEFNVELDNIIIAVGETLDKEVVPKEVECTTEGRLSGDAVTMGTNIKGVFAGGDAVLGPSSVIEAIATGKKAATSIHRYLRGESINNEYDPKAKRIKEAPREGVEKKPRQAAPLLPTQDRLADFKEVNVGFDNEMAFAEAERCMGCGSKAFIQYLRDCQTCALCEGECPNEAITCYPLFERRVVTAW